MDIKFIARLKTDYNNWKELFDSTATEMNILCDDHKTVVGQIGKNAALIALYDVDSSISTENILPNSYIKKSSDFVDKHEIYSVSLGRVA